MQLTTESLESRSMLALTIDLVGGVLQVTQDANPDATVGVVFSTQTFAGATGPVQASAIRITGNTAGGSPIATGTNLPFNDPVTGLPQITGISLVMQQSATEVVVTDQLAGITNVTGGAIWTVSYAIGGGTGGSSTASGSVAITNPSRLLVATAAGVEIDGDFTANDGYLRVAPREATIGKTTPVQADDVTITTSAGTKAIAMQGGITATNSITLATDALLNVTGNISAPSVTLDVAAGATQATTGGTVTAASLTLASGAGVTFSNSANAIGNIASITAAGQDIVIKTSGTVSQTGAILARSLQLEATGAVTLTNLANDLDQLGISSSGAIQYVDGDSVQLGVNGLGVQALGGNSVTLTTTGALTQGASGRVRAGTFTANINTSGGGNDNLLLNSANNEVARFVANNTSAGGDITFLNAAVGGVLTLGDGVGAGVTAINGDITITNTGEGITVASPVSAGLLGSISLTSTGAISQNAAPVAATLTAKTLTVVNNDATGAVTLGLANNVRNVAITNNATASGGITFKGSTATTGSLVVGVGGVGVTASGGTVTIDANNRKLMVDAAITVGGGGDVVLVADGGVSQSNTAAITADDLTVTNTTAGVVALESPTNDVANLVISNKVASGTVRYVDLNDLALQAGGGIQAGDSITLKVGGAFVSTPGNVLAVTGPTGSVSLTTDGTATLGGAVTGTTGVTVAAGTATKVSDVSVNAALTGGAGPVDIKATGAVASSTAGTISGSSVTLDGAKNVTLAAAVNAVTGGIVVNSASGALVTAAAATLTAAAGVTSTTQGSATFGGAVTAPSINVVAGVAPALSSIGVNGVFTATGGVSLAATDAITTAATITAASVTAQSGGATTLGGKVTSTGGAVNFTAGGTFTANSDLADILSAGVATVTSKGAMSLAGSVSGTQVTLTAGTPTSGAAINLLDTVDSTAGQLKIEAVGGAVTTGVKATTTATGGDLSISGTAGVTLGAAATSSAANIAIAATAGAVAVNQVSATAGTVTLAAANGVTQAAKTGIQSLALEVTNSTAGSITLSEPANSVDSFAAANAAPGGKVVFRNSKDVTLAGVSAANGPIDLTVGGKIAVDGAINAGTGDVAVTASGEVSQSPTATILATNLKVNTTVGDILLGFAANDVDFLSGANGAASGKFEFTDADDIQLATPLTPLTTNGGDITVASGKSGVGPMTIGGTVDAGDGFISLQAAGGITGLASHAITSGTGLQLANNTSGDIDLTSRGNAFPTLSAVTAPGGNISLYDALSVTLEKHVTTAGTTAGLSAVGGVIKLTANGGVDQTSTAPVIAKDATFLTEGDVTLDVSSTNDVANLAIQNTGLFSPVSYTDANDLAIGVGTNGVVTLLADITLESSGGAITLNGLVSNGGGSTTTLRASGAITQPAASITSGNLVMASGTDIFVERPGNTIGNLRAFAANELRFRNAANFEVGLNRAPVAPVPATATVTVDATGVATFSEPFVVPMTGPDRPLQAGDVLVINDLPYRVKSVIGLTAELIAADGTPDEYPAGTSFTVLTPQEIEVGAAEVYLNSVIGGIRVTAGIDGEMTLTAAGFVEYVVSNTQDVGGGSLRQMIGYSNVNRGARTVNGIPLPQPMRMVFDEFLYPVQDIFITSALPAVVNPLNIIGERVEVNVTDYERVGIDGTGVTATSIVHGIRYAAGSQGSSVSGLAVYGFATGGGFRIVSGLNTFVNNYAGVRRDGTTLTANKMGFEFSGRTATSNTVGTYVVDEALANVIGGNSFAGIVARNGATANAIVGNYIGTDAVGSDLGNLGDGIVFEAVNGNIVGARTAILPDGTPAASNVIANNNASGVRIAGARAATTALGNLIENNRIRDNAINGIEITGSTFQSVGGAQLRQANIITGQLTGSGVRVAQSADVSVVANYIGVDAVGTSGLGNAASGVMIDGSVRTLVNAGNRIASNGTGVTIRNGSIETRVEGNWIGTDSAGSALGNVGDGVLIDRSVGNFVRQGNTISNNGANGVNITDSTAAALAQGNFVTGNLIAGNGNVGSGTGAGIRVSGGARHSLGQTGVGNVITANAGEGIRVDRSPLTGGSVGIMIQANFIGTNANEETDPALGNGVGIRLSRASAATVNGRNVVANNVQDGVVLEGTVRSQVGGANAGTGNVITGNGGNGVTITNVVGTGSVVNSGNNVYGNEITANGGAGVVVRGVTTNGASTTSNVVVGVRTIPGQAPVGAANVISGNAGNGVTIDGAQSVLVQGNSIFENGGVPIALLNNGNLGAAAPTLTRAVLVQRSNSLTQVVVDGTFAQTGTGRVTVNKGTATFNVAQPSLKAGSVVVINGTGFSVAEKVSNTVFRLAGNPTLTTAGVGRVSAKSGVATFSVPQSATLVGRAIVVAGRSYTVSNLSANGRTASLSGAPTFAVSGFSLLQPQAFNVVDATVLNQQFVVDIFLNAPADGNPTTGAGYGMRTFVGRATVTVGPTGTGAFSATVNLPAGVSAVGQYVTATATTLRASALASAFSTSPVSSRARQLVFASAAT
jgi:fibronectin-binding autotransporter adhesin